MEAKRKRGFRIMRRTMKMNAGIAVLVSLALLLLLTSFASAEDCGCNSCHGNPPLYDTVFGGPYGLATPPTGSTTSGAHHLRAATSPGHNQACYRCHYGGMPESTICANYRLQIGFDLYGYSGVGTRYDGQPLIAPYSYEATNGTIITTGGTKVCFNLYCHGDGTSVSTGIITPSMSPPWDYGQTLPCNFCHGNTTYTDYRKAMPTYAQDQPKSNSHQIHQLLTCNYCHYSVTHDGTSIADTSKNANGVYEVVPDTNALYEGIPVTFQYVYDIGGGKCFGGTNSCHIARGWSGDRNWGAWRMTVNTTWSPGTACYEVIFTGSVGSGVGLVAPYTYFWDFGDGKTSTDQNPAHVYLSAQEYTATLSVRDAKNHLGTKTVTVKPATPNIPPVLKLSFVSISGYTVTLKDESYDPDYNQCGHSGPATLTIKWNDPKNPSGSIQSYSVNLTDTPSNTSYTYTYNSGTTTPTAVGIYYEITDNAGAKTTPSSTLMIMIPERYVISGTIATAGGTPVSGVYVARKTTGGIYVDSATTSSTGYYYFYSSIAGTCYVLTPSKVGYNFTPSAQTVCEKNTSLNFTAVPK